MIHYQDDWLTVLLGDCREQMATLPAESVHCVVTSPPYWGLRDYGLGEQGLGLEPTPEAYVEAMVGVFREVKRVLRSDGTLWLNIGDSYNSAGSMGISSNVSLPQRGMGYIKAEVRSLKHKDLVGIPWRLAFALQADGWYLRSDIIWAKPNPMPESVTDRPTKAHEYLFLLTKSPRYYYDADAVREPNSEPTGNGGWQNAIRQGDPDRYQGRYLPTKTQGGAGGSKFMRGEHVHTGGRNLRTVWNIATQPYPGAHFATFPEALVEPCIKAGTSERGVCPECGAPWVREVELGAATSTGGSRNGARVAHLAQTARLETRLDNSYNTGAFVAHEHRTTGWAPSCKHPQCGEPALSGPCVLAAGHNRGRADLPGNHSAVATIPATVLDPFAGSGTVGRVANRLSRRAILIDLSAEYLDQAMLRNKQSPLGLGA